MKSLWLWMKQIRHLPEFMSEAFKILEEQEATIEMLQNRNAILDGRIKLLEKQIVMPVTQSDMDRRFEYNTLEKRVSSLETITLELPIGFDGPLDLESAEKEVEEHNNKSLKAAVGRAKSKKKGS